MAGEDEESDDPNALGKKPVWQRIIIVAAGAVTNLVAGVLVMFILVFASTNVGIGSTTVAEFRDGATSAVSYTHLDVYKRQGRVFFSPLPFSASSSPDPRKAPLS